MGSKICCTDYILRKEVIIVIINIIRYHSTTRGPQTMTWDCDLKSERRLLSEDKLFPPVCERNKDVNQDKLNMCCFECKIHKDDYENIIKSF